MESYEDACAYDIEYFEQEDIDKFKKEGKLSSEALNALQQMIDRQTTMLKQKGFNSMKEYLIHYYKNN